ncbi:MAG: hypothetical protein MJA27_21530, partial [Pseudanabaenales cyanobacterium]|nr:hypothetical protein [Pseudanabaenales cyanobacterium]
MAMIPSSRGSILAQKFWRLQFSNPFSAKQWRSLGQLIGLFSLCCFLIVSCGGSSGPQTTTSADTAETNGRITLGTTLSARTLDPADAYEIFPGILLYNLGDRLYAYAPGTT